MGVNARLTSHPPLPSFKPGEEHFFHISVNIHGFVHVSWANFGVHLFKGFIPYWKSDTVGVEPQGWYTEIRFSVKNQHSVYQLHVRFGQSVYYNHFGLFFSEIFYITNICGIVIAENIDQWKENKIFFFFCSALKQHWQVSEPASTNAPYWVPCRKTFWHLQT